MKAVAAITCAALAGCATTQVATPTEVRVPVAVVSPCVQGPPAIPKFIDRVQVPQSPADVVTLLAAGIIQRETFIARLIAVLTACSNQGESA